MKGERTRTAEQAPGADPVYEARGPEEDAVGAAPDFTGLDTLRSASGPCEPLGEYPECGRGTCADCRDDRALLELDERERRWRKAVS